MKKMLLVGILLISSLLSSFSQGLGFNYQAMIRSADGEAIVDQDVVMRIGIVHGSLSGDVLYTETHDVQSNAYGLVNLVVGTGDVVTGVFADIDWSNGPFFIKVELDAEPNGNYVTLGTTQLLSVPFANYAFSGGSGSTSWTDAEQSVSTNKKVGIGTSSPSSYLHVEAQQPTKASDPIFEVKNALGKTVFAVYENEVKVFVDDTATNGGFTVNSRDALDATKELFTVKPDETTIYVEESATKATRGGFAISGRTTSKEDTMDIFRVTPTLAEFIVSEPTAKATRGGFAISGRTTSKGITEDLLSVKPSMTEFFVESIPAKATRGGFAISGRTTSKESLELMNITPDFTRFYVEEDTVKATRGGFAISGRTTSKEIGAEIFKVTPGLTEVFVEENTATKATRGGFAISGRTTSKSTGIYDVFTVQPERTEIFIKDNPLKSGIPGFSIFGLDDEFGAGELFSVTEAGTVVNTTFAVAPEVTTGIIEAVTQTSAMSGGAVVDSGGATVIEVGIIYNTTGALNTGVSFDDPAVAGIVPGDPAFADDFSGLMMNGLAPSTTYQVRAYAVNADGVTGYGSIKTFTTGAPFTVTFDVVDSNFEQPINGATITVNQVDFPYNSWTNAPGDYTFELPSGEYGVNTVADGFYSGSTIVFIDSGQVVRIFLDDAPAQLTMNVVDNLGNPVPYAYIDLNDGVQGFEYAETDTMGVAKVYLPAGTWNYTIYETDYTQMYNDSVTMVTDVDQTITATVPLKPTYTVDVSVQDTSLVLVEGADVWMYKGGKKGDAKYLEFNGTTGADGTVTFTDVPADFYNVDASFGALYGYSSTTVDQNTTVSITLMPAKKDK